jgi:hypothetical protein
MTTRRLFWNFICRNIVITAVIWAIYGGIYGTVIYPVEGTITAAVYVGFAAVPFGLINGLLSSIFTYYFSRNNQEYPYQLGAIGFLICILYIGLLSLLVIEIDIVSAIYATQIFLAFTMLIQPMSAGLISYSIARWYQKQTRKILNNQDVYQSATPEIQKPELAIKIKPQYTDIVCNKNTEYIEIIIITPGLSFAILGLLSFITPFILINLFKPIPLFTGIDQYGIAGIVSPSIFTLFVLVIFLIIFIHFANIKLRIDRFQITLKKEIGELNLNVLSPSRTETIQSIHKLSVPCGRDASKNIIWLTNKLEIVAGSQKYSPTSFHKLSSREIDWIAAEISEWLELPIDTD